MTRRNFLVAALLPLGLPAEQASAPQANCGQPIDQHVKLHVPRKAKRKIYEVLGKASAKVGVDINPNDVDPDQAIAKATSKTKPCEVKVSNPPEEKR